VYATASAVKKTGVEKTQYVMICNGEDTVIVGKISVQIEKLFVDEIDVNAVVVNIAAEISKAIAKNYTRTEAAH
jgi:hypothetical protein